MQTMPQKKRLRITWWRRWLRASRVFRLLLWTIWVIYRERQRVIKARARGDYEVQPNVEVLIDVLVAFRKAALQLGVLMIKLGQFLSSRADLLPERALAVLSSLQDEVPPEPFEHVVSVIELEMGRPVHEIFSSLEQKCTAAASLGQVHKGVLAATGETVAVKIQRPNIEQLVAMDLSTIRFVIWLINRFVNTGNFIDLMGVYREFRATVYQEIDYVTEAANAKRFREMFQHDPTVYIPHINEEYVSRHMLVLEWIDGIKINDYEALEAAHIDRLEVANRTVQAYFFQFFQEGFFHADPHPGNIFVKQGSTPDDPIIAFVDFGMVGTLNRSLKKGIRDIFLGFLARDSRSVAKALSQLGFIGEGANMTAIERGLGLMLEQYYGISLGAARDLEFGDIAQEVEGLLYGQPFQIPAQFAFSGRAVGTLVGVATGLAPNFNLVEIATPYARDFLGLGFSSENIEKTLRDLLSQAIDTGRQLITLPNRVEDLITKIESGQVEFKIANFPGVNTRGRGRRRGAGGAVSVAAGGIGRGFSQGVFFLASLAAGVFLLSSAHLFAPGWFCLGLSGLLALGLLFRR